MGIRPTGTGPKPVYGQDNTTSRYQDWVTDLEQAGGTGGDVLVEIDAKAGSSNQTMTELAAAVTALEERVSPLEASHDWVSEDKLVVIQRRGLVVMASGRVTIPAGETYTDINLPDWAKPIKFDFLQFPASYQDATGRGQVRKKEGVARIFGAENQKLNFSTAWCI